IAIIRGAPNEEEAKRFYEFVTTPDSLVYSAHKYYRIPVRNDLDRSKWPSWMNEPFIRLPLDWNVLQKEGNDWITYWDTQIRGRGGKGKLAGSTLFFVLCTLYFVLCALCFVLIYNH